MKGLAEWGGRGEEHWVVQGLEFGSASLSRHNQDNKNAAPSNFAAQP